MNDKLNTKLTSEINKMKELTSKMKELGTRIEGLKNSFRGLIWFTIIAGTITIILAFFLLLSSFKKTSQQTPKVSDINNQILAANGGVISLYDGDILGDTSLLITNKTKLTLLGGQNTKIIFKKYNFNLIASYCNNLTIRNMKLDYDPLPYAQGLITRIATDTVYVTQTLGSPFDTSIFAQATQRYILFRTPSGGLIPNIPNVLNITFQNIHRVSQGHYYIVIRNLPTTGIVPGDYLIFDPSQYNGIIGGAVFSIHYSSNIFISNIEVNASPATAFSVRFSDHCFFKNIKDVPPPGRFISSCRDGFNMINGSGPYNAGPIVDQADIENNGDDGLNIRLTPVIVDSVASTNDAFFINLDDLELDDTSLLKRYIGNIGDTFMIVKASTGVPINTNTIITTGYQYISGFNYKITINQPNTHLNDTVYLYDLSNSYGLVPAVVNSTFKQNRRVGALLLTRYSTIVNNIFDTMPAPGIYLSNQFGSSTQSDLPGASLTISLSPPCNSLIAANTFIANNFQTGANIPNTTPVYFNPICGPISN